MMLVTHTAYRQESLPYRSIFTTRISTEESNKAHSDVWRTPSTWYRNDKNHKHSHFRMVQSKNMYTFFEKTNDESLILAFCLFLFKSRMNIQTQVFSGNFLLLEKLTQYNLHESTSWSIWQYIEKLFVYFLSKTICFRQLIAFKNNYYTHKSLHVTFIFNIIFQKEY